MHTPDADAFPCAGDWTAIEARYRRAKEALRDARHRHSDAAQEFLLARAELRLVLETAFPGAKQSTHPPVPESRCACKRPGRAPLQIQEG